jgi:hypothetical protein
MHAPPNARSLSLSLYISLSLSLSLSLSRARARARAGELHAQGGQLVALECVKGRASENGKLVEADIPACVRPR